MEFLTKPLSNEKVVRPALIYSLFPNVPPTIYFGTPDERGKPGRVSTWNSPRRRMLVKLAIGWKGFPEWLCWCLVTPLVHQSDEGIFIWSIL